MPATAVGGPLYDGCQMENSDLKSMAIDDLWQLHEQVAAKLARELAIEKARLEERLQKLGSASKIITSDRQRRPYPKVLPKSRQDFSGSGIWEEPSDTDGAGGPR